MKTRSLIATSAVLCIIIAGGVFLDVWRGPISAAIAEPAPQTFPSAFTVIPTSGPSPLAVEFSYHADVNVYYSIDFGDGLSSSLSVCGKPTGYRGGYCSFTASHTYSSPGSYMAQLIEKRCTENSPCNPPSEGKISAVVKIVVDRSTD